MAIRVESFFEAPGFWFNFLSFAFGALGIGIGVFATWIALVQIRKTQSAAEAAKFAAEDARKEIGRAFAIMDLQKLSGICREIITNLSAAPAGDVRRPLHELRMGLSQFHATNQGRSLGQAVGSIELVATIVTVQQKLDACGSEGPSTRLVSQCLSLVKTIDERLHQMGPEAVKM